MSGVAKKLMSASGGGEPEGAWDLSYAYYDDPLKDTITTAVTSGDNFLVGSFEATPISVFFKPDGLSMYVIGDSGDEINEFALSTAWNISTASFVRNFSVGAQDGQPKGMFFKPDGTKVFVCGDQDNRVNEYSLSTAWNISTMSFTQGFSVGAQDATPRDVWFKPDGTVMYIAGNQFNDVFEYALSTAWDLSSASYTQAFDASLKANGLTGVSLNADGTKMYILETSGSEFHQYSLGTAWDISTAVFSSSLLLPFTTASGFFFSNAQGLLYAVENGGDRIHQFVVGGFSVAAQETSPQDVAFKPDGTEMYVIGLTGDDVNQYSLGTAWDTSTATYVRRFDTGTVTLSPFGLAFKPDGTAMYTIGDTVDVVAQWSLSVPWDISSTSYVQQFSVVSEEENSKALAFKPDGTKMYVLGVTGDDVNEYDLSTAWDVSTATYLQNFSVAAQDVVPQGLSFKPDGKKMYVTGANSLRVLEYDIGTAWSVPTASFLQGFSVALQEKNIGGLFFRDDGTQMFIIGPGNDRVFSYTLGVQE